MIKNAIILALCIISTGGFAAGPVDPDWPCIQRKQPTLSVAQIWSGPAIEVEASTDPKLQSLAGRIAARRTPLQDAQSLIEDFAKSHSAKEVQSLFLNVFENIQTARGRVMDGITRYAHKQASLDAEINSQRRHFDALLAAEPKDFDAIDKAEAAIDWSTRIFIDRQQSLTYVCETPVILEQRAFALARLFATVVETD